MVRILQGQYADARTVAADGIRLGQELGERIGTGWCLECIAAVDAAETRFARAVRLWGATDMLSEAMGSEQFANISAWARIREPHMNAARESLDSGTFAAAWSEGRALSMPQAVQYALAETPHDRVPDDASRPGLAE